MKLRELFEAGSVELELEANSKDDVLKELVGLLNLDDHSQTSLYKRLKQRENLGSTGIGRRISIPHCRSRVVSKIRLAYGRKSIGIDFDSIDGDLVRHFFLIVAPPLEISNQYLPVLGKIAQFAKDPEVPTKLSELSDPEEFLQLLEDLAS